MLLLAAVLVAVRLGDMAVNENFYGPGPLSATADLVIPKSGTAGAAAALSQAGVLEYPLFFRVAAWVTRRDGPVHAGEFLFPAHVSLADVLRILRHGAPVQHQVTIPEGLTGVQIAAIINIAKAATGHVDAPPEGAVLPQTYDFTRGTPRPVILARAEAAMRQALGSAWKTRGDVPVTSPAQAVVLASIVQQETPVAAELPEIAAVYENRLNQGMKLQADPTVIFAASGGKNSGGMAISREDLGSPSPYNTYMVAGLPPGPICAPGIAAIEAVLHPAQSDALYFVATGTGGHIFADNFTQQLKNIAAYRATHK